MTNPSPDLLARLREGTNLYTNVMIVLDVQTGKLRWYRQLVPNSHDWDLTHASSFFNATINGAARHLVATAGKEGVLRASIATVMKSFTRPLAISRDQCSSLSISADNPALSSQLFDVDQSSPRNRG